MQSKKFENDKSYPKKTLAWLRMSPQNDRFSHEMKDEVFEYLEVLRESGETNMFGAGVYLQKHFELPKDKAIMYLTDWMKSYNKGEE